MERILSRIMALLLVVLVAVAALSAFSPSMADSAAGPMEVESYTVQPGQTLWTYAQMVTPEGGDVNQSVEELVELNHLEGTSLEVGQRILVPVEEPDD
ncbi:peptidoglycan-binding LysM domain [Bifidobacterium callitrichos DSM 23973]|uniref:Peptidoglycan-binding LysM domain n=2 Tax=Bifidobacterium TaxID=1678 RepID=A0A087A9M8_9BIFI|nr:peptidoglycan-binding LysM domain [Bifidobacterium callitrichos DSM 23973]